MTTWTAHWPSLPQPGPNQPSEDQTAAGEELVLDDQSAQVVVGSLEVEVRSAGTELDEALEDQSSQVWLGSVGFPR